MDEPERTRFISMISKARELRKQSTMPEQLLWEVLRNRQLAGLKFRRQQPIGPFIADFICHEFQLVIEIDGRSHDGRHSYDESRTKFIVSQGYRVFRIQNDDVLNDLEAVALGILKATGMNLHHYFQTGEVRR